MAKRKLILNESTTRKFMKYANIKPTYVSNFLSEAEHAEKKEEEDEKMEEGYGMGNREDEEDEKMEEGYGMGNREDEEEKEKLKEQEEDEMDMYMETEDEMDMKAESDAAESLVMDLLAHVQKFAEEKGVTMELDGDEDIDDDDDMDDEGMEDMDAAPEGGDMGMADDDVDADLEAAGAEAIDEEAVIAEVTRRVARRLLRESAKSK